MWCWVCEGPVSLGWVRAAAGQGGWGLCNWTSQIHSEKWSVRLDWAWQPIFLPGLKILFTDQTSQHRVQLGGELYCNRAGRYRLKVWNLLHNFLYFIPTAWNSIHDPADCFNLWWNCHYKSQLAAHHKTQASCGGTPWVWFVMAIIPLQICNMYVLQSSQTARILTEYHHYTCFVLLMKWIFNNHCWRMYT